jgi:hypothetical protein
MVVVVVDDSEEVWSGMIILYSLMGARFISDLGLD